MKSLMVLVMDGKVMSFLEKHWENHNSFNGEYIERTINQKTKINERKIFFSSLSSTKDNGSSNNSSRKILFLELLLPYSGGDIILLRKLLQEFNSKGLMIGTEQQLIPFSPIEIGRNSKFKKITCLDGINFGILVRKEERKCFEKDHDDLFGKKFIKELSSILYNFEDEAKEGKLSTIKNKNKECYRR